MDGIAAALRAGMSPSQAIGFACEEGAAPLADAEDADDALGRPCGDGRLLRGRHRLRGPRSARDHPRPEFPHRRRHVRALAGARPDPGRAGRARRVRRLRPHRLGGDGRAAGRGTPNAPPLPARLQRPRACPRAAPTTRLRGRLRGPDGRSRLPRRRLALRRLPAPGERAAARGPCVRLGGSAGRIHAVWTRSLARRRLADRALLAPCQHRPVRNGSLPRSPAATPCLLRTAARRTTAPAA